MVRNKATIYETPHGFLWAEQGRYYKTLASAQRAIQRDAKIVVKSPAARGVVATLLEVYS
jgi:hypothetical protein